MNANKFSFATFLFFVLTLNSYANASKTIQTSCGRSTASEEIDSELQSKFQDTIQVTQALDPKITLVEQIDKNTFGLQYAEALETDKFITYYYGKYESGCKQITNFNIFTFCSANNSSNSLPTKIVVNSDVDIKTKQLELKNLIQKSNKLITNGHISYLLFEDGSIVIIDSSLPIAANPVSIQNPDKTTETLLYMRY